MTTADLILEMRNSALALTRATEFFPINNKPTMKIVNKTPEQRAALNLPPMPLNDNHYRSAYETPNAVGILGLYAIGVVSGLMFSLLIYIFAMPNG